MNTRNVVLVASTAGHIRHLSEIGLTIKEELPANVSLLHMPLSRQGDAPTPGLEEFVFCHRGMISRNEMQKLEEAGQSFFARLWQRKFGKLAFPSRPRFLRKPLSHTLFCVRRIFFATTELIFKILTKFFETTLNLPLFYLLLIVKVAAKAINPWRDSSKGSILNESVRHTFATLSNLMRFFPAPAANGVGRLTNVLMHHVFWGLWAERWQRSVVLEFLARVRPGLIVLPELNWGYSHAILVEYCRRNDIPLLIFPYSMAGRQEWVASFWDYPESQVDGIFKRLLARAFPKWTLEYGGKKLMLPLLWLLSCELTGFSPSDPWVTNSGTCGWFAVDNEITRNFYLREGVDVTKWRVLGSVFEDRLYKASNDRENEKRRLAEKYGFVADRRWVVIAIPPDQFDVVSTEDLQFTEYETLCRSIVEGVTKAANNGWCVIINLHPRCDRRIVGVLEDAGGILIDRALETLLPLADIFVASASATIRWAIACGVPVINYDVYHYQYDDFRNFAGVIEVADLDGYHQVLRRMVEDPDWFLSLRGLQQRDSRKLFNLDGHGKERMLALVEELLTAGSGRGGTPV